MDEIKNESQRDASVQGPVWCLQDLINNGDIKSPEASINAIIRESKIETSLISDGYHTFGELYEHRIELFIALCRPHQNIAWKTHVHSDGTVWDGWFLLGLYETSGLQISYHSPEKYWDVCSFVRTLDIAPEFDGHTSADVLKRLREL